MRNAAHISKAPSSVALCSDANYCQKERVPVRNCSYICQREYKTHKTKNPELEFIAHSLLYEAHRLMVLLNADVMSVQVMSLSGVAS